VNVEFTSTAMK